MNAAPDVGGRPRGEVRQALLAAALQLQRLRMQAPLTGTCGEPLVGGTWLELMQFGRTGRDSTTTTLKNMVRARELQIVGAVKEDHSDRPLAVYAPAPPEPTGLVGLQHALQAWTAAP